MHAKFANLGRVLAGLVLSLSAMQPVFAATEYDGGGFYALYEENRREGVANYITEDLLLQAYSMVRARRLVAMERETLLPALQATVGGLQQLLKQKPDAYSSRSLAYSEILQALLDGRDQVKLDAQAQAEYALILKADSVQLSPLWGYPIDYRQLAPSGQYLNDELLSRYFVASRYASSVLFAVVPSEATGVSDSDAAAFAEQALELSQLLADPVVASSYQKLTSMLDWQFGATDDLRAEDVRMAAEEAGQDLASALQTFAIAEQRVPKIIGQALMVDQLEQGLSAQQALIGWRLLPARWSAASEALQTLVFSDQESLQWPCQDCPQPALSSRVFGGWYKSYPSYRELMAAMGSEEAQAWIDEQELSHYNGYEERSRQVTGALKSSSGLAAEQSAILRAVLSDDESASALQSGAGFWLWQRYLGRLYKKQSSTPYSKGVTLPQRGRSGASIAVNTPLYLALADLAQAHTQREGDSIWSELSQLLQRCAQISQRATALSAEDEQFLNDLDLALKALTGRDDLPIVTDLHSNYQEGQVLQIALARPLLVQRDGARGARFQVREFLQPMTQPLDNLAWRQRLARKGTE